MTVSAAQRTTSRELKIRGQQLRVDIRPGNGFGTPLLMCSGIGTSYEVFDLLIDALHPDIEIIRVDMPGVGGSPDRLLPYSFADLARLLARMLDNLGHQRVDVLGFSWGGALAQQFAVLYRNRCRRLVLISTSTGMLSVPGSPHVLATMLTPKVLTGTDAADVLFAADTGVPGDNARRAFRNTQIVPSGLGYLYQVAAICCWTSLPFLRLIRQPTLVIGGHADPIVPVANAKMLAKLIPNATLHTFAGGHIRPLAAPSRFGPLITEFLAEHIATENLHLRSD